jgi:hypothetical protein
VRALEGGRGRGGVSCVVRLWRMKYRDYVEVQCHAEPGSDAAMYSRLNHIFLTVRLGLVSLYQVREQERPTKEKHQTVKRLN